MGITVVYRRVGGRVRVAFGLATIRFLDRWRCVMRSIRVFVALGLLVAGSGWLAAQETRVAAPEENSTDTSVVWKSLFDGKSLKGWEVAKGCDYEEQGKVEVQDGCLVLGTGQPATGVRWTEEFPKTNYEIELEGKRVAGNDFFCGMSFPVGRGALTLILGGWGGWVVGLSCLDGYRAAENETCTYREFKTDQWYRIRVQVTPRRCRRIWTTSILCGIEIRDRKLTCPAKWSRACRWGSRRGARPGAWQYPLSHSLTDPKPRLAANSRRPSRSGRPAGRRR